MKGKTVFLLSLVPAYQHFWRSLRKIKGPPPQMGLCLFELNPEYKISRNIRMLSGILLGNSQFASFHAAS